MTPAQRAVRNIKWIELHCHLPEGKNVGEKVVLAEFMKDDLRAIYGNPHGTRRAIICRGRKNAKTTECAFILLLHLCGPESTVNSQLYSTAQSRDQAALIFSLASKIVRISPDFRNIVKIHESSKSLTCPARGTMFRALSAEVTTAFGLSPVLTIHDELGQVKGPRFVLYDAMETATAAQEEPMTIIISTQAPTDADLLSILIDDAKTETDPRTILRFQSADEDLDPFSKEAIRQANPAFDVFMNRKEVLAMAEDARRMPARESEYRNLVLNQRVESNNPFITHGLWKACGAKPKEIDGVPVYGGLDLSEVRDLTALMLIGRVDNVWQVHPTFWLPSQGLEDKARLDRVPYDMWHESLSPRGGGTFKKNREAKIATAAADSSF